MLCYSRYHHATTSPEKLVDQYFGPLLDLVDQPLANLLHQALCTLLGISKHHVSVVLEEDWVLKAGITSATHLALAEDHLPRFPDFNHRHSPDVASRNFL